MDAMVAEYYAFKTADYLRDVVAPKSIRQERWLTELANSPSAAETTTARPRIWTQVFNATRSAVDSAERRFVARISRRPAEPFSG